MPAPGRHAHGAGARAPAAASGKPLTLGTGPFLQSRRPRLGSIVGMTTPVHAHFSDSWWADIGAVEEQRRGGVGLWLMIMLLSTAPGIGVLLTVVLD